MKRARTFLPAFGLLAMATFALACEQEPYFGIPGGGTAPAAGHGNTRDLLFCTYFGETPMGFDFSSLRPASVEAQQAVNTMLKKAGLTTSILVYVGPVPNASAARVGGKVAIIYDPGFMQGLHQKANSNNWSVLSVLAHELGHLENHHIANAESSTPPLELQADFYSGWMLRRLGAPQLSDAQSAMQVEGSPVASATHPAKRDRLAAIEQGFNDNGGANVPPTGNGGDQGPGTGLPPPQRPQPPRMIQVPCQHRGPCQHPGPCEHRGPCQHRGPCAHRIPCQHRGPYGNMHPFDQMHPADPLHPFDQMHPADPLHPFDQTHPFDLVPAPDGAPAASPVAPGFGLGNGFNAAPPVNVNVFFAWGY